MPTATPATPAPAAAVGAEGLAGYYHCLSDAMHYQVLPAPKAHGGGLLLRRRYPHEPAWRPAVPTTAEHVLRLLRFGSFTPLLAETI